MYILGINAYHGGAAACLIHNGQLVAAAEEERFTRVKYFAGFPTQAIRYCLAAAGITPAELDHVGVSRDPRANLPQKAIYLLSRRPNFSFIRDRLSNATRVGDLKSVFCAAFDLKPSAVRIQFHNVEHHRAHMASAFFVSPYNEAAVLSVDGMGDFVSTMWGVGMGNRIAVMGEITFPHSLGYLYTAVSQWLGFPKYGDEGKVMGLAPYGTPRYLDHMRKILLAQTDGTFELDMDYFALESDGVSMSWSDGEPVIGTLYSQRLVDLLGPPRAPRGPIEPYHQDIAASLQVALEEAELLLVQRLQRSTGQRALCMAGGVALNSAFNGKILPQTEFDDIYIQPAAGDSGTALGAAYYIHHQILGAPRCYELRDPYTGPGYDNAALATALARAGVTYSALDDDALVARAAERIADGQVIGWFQGRMEWGPRALGNRSILADPRRADMKDTLNARIKHREPFRPFAPSILQEVTGAYFDQAYPDPFMLKVYGVRPERQASLPAVTHVDGTGRLQTVDRGVAPRYWSLIKAFEAQTGVPVVLNTSFNENEPIVCRPEEAIDCFLRTRMDALFLGNFMATRGRDR